MGYKRSFFKSVWSRVFLCGPVIKTLCFHCKGHEAESWWGIQYPASHGTWQKEEKKKRPYNLIGSSWRASAHIKVYTCHLSMWSDVRSRKVISRELDRSLRLPRGSHLEGFVMERPQTWGLLQTDLPSSDSLQRYFSRMIQKWGSFLLYFNQGMSRLYTLSLYSFLSSFLQCE